MNILTPLVVSILANASHIKDELSHCERIVKNWSSSSIKQEVENDKHTLKDLLFFLHVPRTGGRIYHRCILEKLYSNSKPCHGSYDKLRFDPSNGKCRLWVSHDDYSMMSKLPKQNTSVVTILRNPVERVFSIYEFSIEIAARFLVHPNLTSVTPMAGKQNKTGGLSTLDVWPWTYLVPWMREDLFARRDARVLYGITNTKSKDPYNMDEIIMPFHQYINDPIAQELVHNGATFQVAGLANNSFSSEAQEVRHCVQKYKILGEDVLTVAKKRLDDMIYVGLTENHRESARMFANVVGGQLELSSQVLTSNSSADTSEHNESDSKLESHDHQIGIPDQKTSGIASSGNFQGKMTVDKIMGAYESCTATLRKTQTDHHTKSLKRIAPANFSKQDRLHVPEVVIQQIIALNNLDMELYKYAQGIFAKQHNQTIRHFASIDGWENIWDNVGGTESWKNLSLAMSILVLFLFLFLFVNARRTFKIKL